MNRDEAILIISKNKLTELSVEKQQSILLECMEADDEEVNSEMSEILQNKLVATDDLIVNCEDTRYYNILIDYLRGSYIGVKNEYLSERVSNILGKAIIVNGTQEKLIECPCCKYETLEIRGNYDICPVCFWEDEGNENLQQYSGPNHMTLQEGRDNFSNYGAVDKKFIIYINPDSKKRYNRSDV